MPHVKMEFDFNKYLQRYDCQIPKFVLTVEVTTNTNMPFTNDLNIFELQGSIIHVIKIFLEIKNFEINIAKHEK